MLNILDLPVHQFNELINLEPTLDKDWKTTLMGIVLSLDKESQQSIYHAIIKPKGIIYDASTKQLITSPRQSLSQLLKTSHIASEPLIEATASLLELLTPPLDNSPVDALTLVQELESRLTFFDHTPIPQTKIAVSQKHQLRQAFLYDFANYLDTLRLEVPKNVRQLDENTLKTFLKQVFIKSQLQGYQFKYYEAPDLDLYGIHHFPAFIKQEAQNRKLLLIETKDCWFLLTPSENADGNAFSTYRFLYEEQVGGGLFLTGLALPKQEHYTEQAQKFFLARIQRLFSVDQNIDSELKKFVLTIKAVLSEQLEPLLLNNNFGVGGNSEQLVARRTTRFEEILSQQVLQKLPAMFNFAGQSQHDKEFFLMHLSQFFDKLLHLIEKFRLHPFARKSFVAKNLSLKIVAMNALVQKNQSWLFYHEAHDAEAYHDFKKAMPTLKACYEEAINDSQELEELIAQSKKQLHRYQEGGFLAKLGFGKPKYTLDELGQAKQDLSENFFVDIMKIAKEFKRSVVFIEHETAFQAHDAYRHYAIAHERYHFTRLPYVIALPEDRSIFNLDSLHGDINWQIFARVDNV